MNVARQGILQRLTTWGKLINGQKDIEQFDKAKKFHICEDNLQISTKIDHLGKIHKWLRIIGLPYIYPSESERSLSLDRRVHRSSSSAM